MTTYEGLERRSKPDSPPQLHHSDVLGAAEIQLAEEPVLYIVQHIAMNSIGWALAFQLKHNHPAIMA